MTGVSELDTLGAWLLEKLSRRAATSGHRADVVGVADNYAGLIEELRQVNRRNPKPVPARNPLLVKLDEVGRAATSTTEDVIVFLQMLGSLFLALVGVLRRPRSLRLTSLVYQLYKVGWQAIPIMVLITFLIGAIIAQQGFFHFRKFGADSYVVDMVGILVLRELGVLIVAIMVAGRSGSAYTAELGSMKMREEIDALSTMGLDPVEVLILPRIIALVCALPILSFIGSMAALYGGGLVAQFYGDMGPAIFLARLHDAVSVTSFKVGIIKAPFMALAIGIVACSEGLRVKGSAELLGTADHDLGGEIDLPGDRAGRAVCRLLRIDRNVAMQQEALQFAIRVSDLVVGFGRQVVIDHLTLDVRKGEILGLVGASGGGKTVLMRTIIGLIPRQSGSIEVMGRAVGGAEDRNSKDVAGQWGILFQQGALFSSLTVRQNIQFPLRENLVLSQQLMDEIATAKLEMVGLAPEDGDKFPAELSGGMTKRVALARALALDPAIVFLDEPTSGLDPIAAGEFDTLIQTLQQTLGLTVFMVTHDLASLNTVCDRVAALADGKIVAIGPMRELLLSEHPWVRAYFHGKRSQMLQPKAS